MKTNTTHPGKMHRRPLLLAVAAGLASLLIPASARAGLMSFGSGANAFNINFVTVGNAGNGNDAGAGGGIYSSPYGGVAYNFNMAVTTGAQDWITKATNLGMTNVTAGAWTGNQPAASITWYKAAGFVNWLNTSTGHQAAYQLNGTNGSLTLWTSAQAWQAGGENLYRHKDAVYFLPSENEWYKAAYHKNDGVTANYWDYATASNSIPTAVASGTGAGSAVYGQTVGQGPADVNNSGGLSAYGTQGQDGNVYEWQESAFDGVNNSVAELRVIRGGDWGSTEDNLRSSFRSGFGPSNAGTSTGFRVASIEPVPEPATLAVGLLCLGVGMVRRRRNA